MKRSIKKALKPSSFKAFGGGRGIRTHVGFNLSRDVFFSNSACNANVSEITSFSLYFSVKTAIFVVFTTIRAFTLSRDVLFSSTVVWKNYQGFSESYKRIRIGYIEAARIRPEEFEKRLSNFINKTRKNKLISGYGGIDKYY